MKKKDISELNTLYLGKSYNKLTIGRIYYDEDSHTWCAECRCECGSTCNKCLNKVISGHTKTCGGSVHIREQGKQHSEWLHSHWDIVQESAANTKDWYKNNPDLVKARSEKHKQWWKDNKDKVVRSDYNARLKRSKLTYHDLLPIIHPCFINDLLSGKIASRDIILTKCPKCGEYDKHKLHDIYIMRSDSLKHGHALLCSKCLMSRASHYEIDIANYVSGFYSGKCVKGDRSIISPLELDLYYPEKKIAIEFNGNYWHSDNYKQSDYHYNKFKKCNDLGITLISIFENEWLSYKDNIISYIKDTFDGKENQLSFVNDNTINLNYPPPNLDISIYNRVYSSNYIINGYKVHTCGYASNYNVLTSLKFITDLADNHNLTYTVNDNGDLEIIGKHLCFHLADMISAEHDSYDRWQSYNKDGIRCVFVYPPDLINKNRVNIYANILIYHCGLSNRVYARNTVVKKYPAIKMKHFFEENNIAGYRSATTAYVLEDKETSEPYMCYLIGHSFFGKGNYDCEIARGACKLGYCIVGGASKLWKHIINDNQNINSIVYYCDRRQYDQRSISHLMDSHAMKGLGNVYMFDGSKSFMNYWLRSVYIEHKLWHSVGDYTNREPFRHKLVAAEYNNGNVITVENPGSFTNIFIRHGYHLEGFKVVKD